ncbi:MAG: histone deacetylase family protein [Actinomycetota bacterium]|nr:histone deacetylase family protein [Actinomycetota bacterium]
MRVTLAAMTLSMPLVWSDRHREHDPAAEIWVGVRTPAAETPARAEAIRAALVEAGAPVVEAEAHDDEFLLAVHDAALVAFLEQAWDDWSAAGLPQDPGQDAVVPYVFAHVGLSSRPPAVPAAPWARPGYFAYDTMTLVGPGTWAGARAAVDVALTAADLVAGGAPAAYACCRPPGHHVTRTAYGGSCYLNNAAIAADRLRERFANVAVLDVDAHHGNGTQEVFYGRGDVSVGSVHVDPGSGWFPHFLGFASENGAGNGEGANRNLPLAPGSGDDPWLEAVAELADWARECDALVISLGVDAAEGDPESPLAVTPEGFRAAGRTLGALGLPTVVVQEGGYDLASLGGLVLQALAGVEEGLEGARG